MKHLVAALAIVLAAALVSVAAVVAVAAAADVSGSWNVDGDVVGNAVKYTCALKQSGEALSGTATFVNTSKELPLKGTVKDRVVTFQFDVDHEGSTYTMIFSGTLGEIGGIEGKIEVGGVEGTFSAKKQ